MGEERTKQIVVNLNKQHADKQGVATPRWWWPRMRCVPVGGPVFPTQQRRKDSLQIGTATSGFLVGWSGWRMVRMVWKQFAGDWPWKCSQQTSMISITLVQPNLLGELWDVSGLSLSWGPSAATDSFAGWMVIPLKTFRPGYRRIWGRESGRTNSEHGTAARLWPGSDQARYHTKTRQGLKYSLKWISATEQRKAGGGPTFPCDLGSSGCRTNRHSGQEAKKKNRPGAWSIPVKQGSGMTVQRRAKESPTATMQEHARLESRIGAVCGMSAVTCKRLVVGKETCEWHTVMFPSASAHLD